MTEHDWQLDDSGTDVASLRHQSWRCRVCGVVTATAPGESPVRRFFSDVCEGEKEARVMREVSVQPEWCRKLPIQQQSVLFLAGRGPDGVGKYHPCKEVHIAYRASAFVAAKYGRPLRFGERADSFMSLHVFALDDLWGEAVQKFFDHHDELAKHYIAHFMHGAEILGYKHPDLRFRQRWLDFYLRCVDMLHLRAESEAEMDKRLGDWGREHWEM